MDPQTLLERMASISPGVRHHIVAKTWIENIDEDEINQQMLINECFAIMVGEAYELGIEFYCTISDLCESLYIMDKTLLLFEVIFPTPLYRSITESEGFKKMISSIVLDGVTIDDESTIQTILEHLAVYDLSTSAIFFDTYIFLQDKMKSTPIFDTYVKSTLDLDTTPFSVAVDDNVVKTYLSFVSNTYSKLLRVADSISLKLPVKDPVAPMYDAINNYKTVAASNDTLEVYSWAYSVKDNQEQLPMVQVLVEKYNTQFRASVPFYEDFFILRGDNVDNNTIIPLILGAYLDTTTKSSFITKVSDVFTKLNSEGKIDTSSNTVLIQGVLSILIQEYYA